MCGCFVFFFIFFCIDIFYSFSDRHDIFIWLNVFFAKKEKRSLRGFSWENNLLTLAHYCWHEARTRQRLGRVWLARVHKPGARPRACIGAEQLKLSRQPAAIRPRAFTESAVGHFVQKEFRPAGIRNVGDHMCLKGRRKIQNGSGNQTPLGGKFTRTCSRGENRGTF